MKQRPTETLICHCWLVLVGPDETLEFLDFPRKLHLHRQGTSLLFLNQAADLVTGIIGFGCTNMFC